MPEIRLVHVSRHICRGLDLTIEDREIFVIVGTTGAGKTTLLNVIAGVTDYEGSVLIEGRNVDKVPPRKRGVGYLFQSLALFPHLTVASNIAFGLQASGIENSVAEKRVSSLMEMMRIQHLATRYPHMLSGGEKKRVALARSLAPSPQILLLDEPTSSLDHQTAKYLRIELINVLKRLGITTVYVTHDLREAEEIADRIAFMSNGRVEQVSIPRDFFFHPQNDCVSEFVGMPNIIECTQSHILASGLVEVVSGDMKMVLPYEGNGIKRIAIPPDDIYVSDVRPPGPALNRFTGTVQEITSHQSTVRVRVSVGTRSLLAELPVSAFNELSLERGKEVHVVIKLRRLRYVES
jgi:ABC-type Fe3+/spermidine/putrescine transport system ATPase subunit